MHNTTEHGEISIVNFVPQEDTKKQIVMADSNKSSPHPTTLPKDTKGRQALNTLHWQRPVDILSALTETGSHPAPAKIVTKPMASETDYAPVEEMIQASGTGKLKDKPSKQGDRQPGRSPSPGWRCKKRRPGTFPVSSYLRCGGNAKATDHAASDCPLAPNASRDSGSTQLFSKDPPGPAVAHVALSSPQSRFEEGQHAAQRTAVHEQNMDLPNKTPPMINSQWASKPSWLRQELQRLEEQHSLVSSSSFQEAGSAIGQRVMFPLLDDLHLTARGKSFCVAAGLCVGR